MPTSRTLRRKVQPANICERKLFNFLHVCSVPFVPKVAASAAAKDTPESKTDQVQPSKSNGKKLVKATDTNATKGKGFGKGGPEPTL